MQLSDLYGKLGRDNITRSSQVTIQDRESLYDFWLNGARLTSEPSIKTKQKKRKTPSKTSQKSLER